MSSRFGVRVSQSGAPRGWRDEDRQSSGGTVRRFFGHLLRELFQVHPVDQRSMQMK